MCSPTLSISHPSRHHKEMPRILSARIDTVLATTEIKKRFGNTLPLDEPIVSPADIYESNILIHMKKK